MPYNPPQHISGLLLAFEQGAEWSEPPKRFHMGKNQFREARRVFESYRDALRSEQFWNRYPHLRGGEIDDTVRMVAACWNGQGKAAVARAFGESWMNVYYWVAKAEASQPVQDIPLGAYRDILKKVRPPSVARKHHIPTRFAYDARTEIVMGMYDQGYTYEEARRVLGLKSRRSIGDILKQAGAKRREKVKEVDYDGNIPLGVYRDICNKMRPRDVAAKYDIPLRLARDALREIAVGVYDCLHSLDGVAKELGLKRRWHAWDILKDVDAKRRGREGDTLS